MSVVFDWFTTFAFRSFLMRLRISVGLTVSTMSPVTQFFGMTYTDIKCHFTTLRCHFTALKCHFTEIQWHLVRKVHCQTCHPPVTLCHPQTGCKRFVAGRSVTLTPFFIKNYIYTLWPVSGTTSIYVAKVIIFHCTDKYFKRLTGLTPQKYREKE